MATRSSSKKVVHDARYKDQVVGRFLNILLQDGKKSTAERVCYGAFDIVRDKTGEPLKVFHAALGNVKPMVEVKSRRVGGASYPGACGNSSCAPGGFGVEVD